MSCCELCGCWTTEAVDWNGVLACTACYEAQHDALIALGPAPHPAVCVECDRVIAEHAGDLTPDGPAHVGCSGLAGRVSAVAPAERWARENDHDGLVDAHAIAEAIEAGSRPIPLGTFLNGSQSL